MYFRLNDLVGLFGVAETKVALRLNFIVRYIMFKSRFVLYKDKGLLPLPHYTELVQTMSKGHNVNILQSTVFTNVMDCLLLMKYALYFLYIPANKIMFLKRFHNVAFWF